MTRKESEPAPARDAWTAELEVDALLAQLRGNRQELIDVYERMDTRRLMELGKHLYAMQNTLTRVVTAKITDNR